MLGFLSRHLARKVARRPVFGRQQDALEERLRPRLGAERDGKRVVRRHEAEDELARRRLRGPGIQPAVIVGLQRRQPEAVGLALERDEVLGLQARQRRKHCRHGFISEVIHALRELGVALGRLALDRDCVGVKLRGGADRLHAFTVGGPAAARLM